MAFPFSTNAVESRTRKNYKLFSETTSMHGFLEVYNAKSYFWRIFWIVVVIGAIGVTSYQVYRAIHQYITQTSLSNIKPLEEDVIYPPISVCYVHWISWLDWKKASSLNFTRESLMYGLSFLTPIFSGFDFNETEAKESFLKNMARQNMSTISEFYKRIAKSFPLVIGPMDKARLVANPPYFKDIDIRWKDPDILLCYKMDGDAITRYLNEKNGNVPPSHPQNTIFNFSTQDFKYSMVSDYMSFEEYNFYIAYWLRVKTTYWITTAHDFSKNFTQMTLSYRIYPDTYSGRFVEISSEYDAYTVVMQTTARKWMNKEDSRCAEGQKAISSDSTCQFTCGAVQRRKLKGCLSLDDAVLLSSDTPERLCRYEISFLSDFFGEDNSTSNTTSVTDWFPPEDLYFDNEALRAKVANATLTKLDKEKEDCISECLPKCERWRYEFTSSAFALPPAVRPLSFTNQTDIHIVFPSKDDILIVIEENSQTWEDFVGNVGGLLGIWTGASILSFIQLAYLCCCYDTACRCPNVCRPKMRHMKPLYVLPPTALNSTGPNTNICSIAVNNSSF